FGVVFRYTDERNYYLFSVSTADHVKRLIKMVDGVATTLWETPGGSAPGALHRIVIDALGERLIGRFDGIRLFEIVDATHHHGQVGLYCSRNETIAFDSVRVSTPPVEAYALFNDKFAVGSLAGWSLVDESSGLVVPFWTASGGVLRQATAAFTQPVDPTAIEKKAATAVTGDANWTDVAFLAVVRSNSTHAIGVVFRYVDKDNYYRFSMDHTDHYRRLVKNVGGVFTTLWEDGEAYEVGRAYELTVVVDGDQLWGYMDGIPLFAVSDADVTHGQVGLYTWRNANSEFSTVTVLPISAAFSDWAFRDNFPYMTVDKWVTIDNGDTGGPSSWVVTADQLTQTSAITGATAGMGTYLVSSKGGRRWTDSRFTAQIGSSGAGTVGLCARFLDESNHYRFEMTDAGGSRLVKVIAGVETVLWSTARNYELVVPVLATIDTVGERVTVSVNGVTLAEVVDDSLASGAVAMYCSANSGAFFDFVRVQEVAWQTYHRFGKGPTVPAGQRLRVLACGPDTAPVELANTLDLYRADVGESGSIHFRGSTCDLRVRAPLDRIEHTRTFQRSSSFTDVADARILRRSDGCAFVLCRPTADPDGSLLPPADYRVKLVYRRNNTTADPQSEVQRENGSASNELTTLDWPAS
ncbi:MAG: hypothetical protein ABIQ39_07380, partial [Ilumatobacteraceae bacterium]